MKALVRLKTFCTGPCIVLCLLALILTIGVQSASANINGAIQSTFNTGTTVNGNIFPSKFAVYLNGGPQNESSNGLPDGIYYFQVTDPNGSHLLSVDDITCRQVQVIGGRFQGVPSGPVPSTCTGSGGDFHANGLLNAANGGSIPVQLCAKSGCPEGAPLSSPDFKNTDNTGGEYKVWITPVAQYDAANANDPHKNFGFDGDTKTDNFKVRPAGAFLATVTVCKFKDLNGNGIQDGDPLEPLIPHWPITATGVDPTTGNPTVAGTTVNTQTGDNGCVAFTYSGGQANHQITFSEGLLTGWTQTAPANGDCTAQLTGTVSPADTCSVSGGTSSTPPSSGGVITVTVNNGDLLVVPAFGNVPPCTSNCTPGSLTVTKTAIPALTRTFKWGISKSVDNTEIDTSGSATFNYTVSVTHDSGTDSQWQVTGSIRLGNASAGDVTGITVADTVDNGGSCAVDTTGFSGTVLAGTHVDLPYICTYSNAPSPAAGTNNVSVSSDQGTFPGQQSFDFASATPANGEVTVVDGSVTVTDTFGGALGTVTFSDPSPTSFPYSHTFTDPAGTCTTHDNTATFTTDTTGATGSDSKSVKVCVGADLTVSKTATPTFNSSITKSPNQTEFDTSSGNSVTITYTVTVTESGWQVAGNITVTNPNDWEDITANLSDAIPGASCTVNSGTTSVLVNRSSSVTVPYTCTFASAPSSASGTNTVTASWTGASTPDTSANGSANYTFGSLTVTDAFNGGAGVTIGTVSTPASTSTFTDPHTVTAPTATCTTYNNTAAITETSQSANASVKVCGASDLSVSKTATPTFNSKITKSPNQTEFDTSSGNSVTITYTVTVTESGWQVAGNITVTNPNDWEDITANLSDAISGASCTVNGGTTSVTVNRSSSVTVPYTCTFASAPSASGTNTATATWSGAFTPDTSASGSKGYTFGSLTVTDAFNGGGGVTIGTVNPPAATSTFTDPHTVTAPTASCTTFNNTAAIVETNQTSSASVKVCGASPLTVIKDANPSFNSNITKTASPGSPAENAGSTTFTYTITVTENGWKVTGNVSVTNPNNWESIALTSVTDTLTGATCSVSPATIPASSTVNLPYSCTFSSVPAASGTNYVTITWNASTAFTSTGSASANKGYAFAPLTVTDTFGSGSPVTLGTISVPTATTKFTDTKTLSPIGGSCTSVTNTAIITPTGQIINVGLGYTTAQATVTACNTATGALTMGFWKNKNGQSIITGGASTGGVCNSGTWLRQFAPFQDLSATASCSQVASYVFNILSSASAGGAAMNAMLKGQMLATALDVYFSDPALGGNKIGAAQALGGVKIDLTHVCKMIDSSGGTGTCSGSFENSSSAFGGATSGMVSFLLSYAAGQSNSGGSIWYGQNKTTQGLAKDTFDEINNQVATIAP